MTQPNPFRPEFADRLLYADLDDLIGDLEGRLHLVDVPAIWSADQKFTISCETCVSCTKTCNNCTNNCTNNCLTDFAGRLW